MKTISTIWTCRDKFTQTQKRWVLRASQRQAHQMWLTTCTKSISSRESHPICRFLKEQLHLYHKIRHLQHLRKKLKSVWKTSKDQQLCIRQKLVALFQKLNRKLCSNTLEKRQTTANRFPRIVSKQTWGTKHLEAAMRQCLTHTIKRWTASRCLNLNNRNSDKTMMM